MKVVVHIGSFCQARTTMSQGVELEVHQSDLSRVAWALQTAARQLLDVEKGLSFVEDVAKREAVDA